MASLLHYLNNPQLKAAGVEIPFTEDQVKEYFRCANDPVYFIENYAKVVSLDDGIVPFKPYPYQKRMIKAIHENNEIIGKLFRQAGKSTIVAAYFSWYVLFNDEKTCAILANKQAIAKEIFSRVQFIIENLPHWLQQGVVEWNKTSFKLENGSRCIASATSASAVRGMSVNLLLLDEFAHLGSALADEFIASVFPTLSSSETAKLIIISTPNGLNHYHKLWVDALNGKNSFVTVEGRWQEHPRRTPEWAEKQLQKLGVVRYRQEIECSFEGSSYTLVDGVKLSELPIQTPIMVKDSLEIYEKPKPEHSYVLVGDISRGRHRDYSALTLIDVSKMPYSVVAIYKNNEISTLEIPHLIYNLARQYNNAFILVEINDLGEEVTNILWQEYEYENMYFTSGDRMSQLRGYPGIRTSTKVKSVGCSVLKELIEKDQLMVNAHKIIEELGVFVMHKKSYAAEDTQINDDLCTTLWLFAWLTKQDVFQEITNNDLRKALTEKTQKYIDSMLTPFGFIQNGVDDEHRNSSKYPDSDDYRLSASQIELLK